MISMNTEQIKAKIEAIQREYQRLQVECPDKLKEGVTKCCQIVEADAKRNLGSHVVTGHLRRSITHTVESDSFRAEGVVGTNVFYAPYVEFGTGIFAMNGAGRKTGWAYKDEKGVWHWTRGGRPVLYMTQAAQSNKEKTDKILIDSVASAIKSKKSEPSNA